VSISQRQARRQRDREDFLRATTQAVRAADPKHASAYHGRIGENAGNTYREHLEDEIRKSVRVYRRIEAELKTASDNHETDTWSLKGIEMKRKAARGYMRGLCYALLVYEDSSEKDNKALLVELEKTFLHEGGH
jgi:GTPase SAR1 family protein